MNQSLLKKTSVFSVIFTVFVLTVVFFAMENSVILAENRHGEFIASAGDSDYYNDDNTEYLESPEDINNDEHSDAADQSGGMAIGYPGERDMGFFESLTFELGSSDSNFLVIPVPPGIEASDIIIENHYLEDEMWIIIEGAGSNFYDNAVISGNRRNITAGSYKSDGNEIILRFSLDNIYEYRSIMEDGAIYIEFVPPREMYDRIVVIDPAFGGSDFGISANDLNEKDITLNIAVKLKEMLDQTDIKVYYTRLADNNLSEDKRVRIANSTRADMLIRIEGDSDENSLMNGTTTIYSNFFIPHFGSIDLADILEKEVVMSIRGKAIGLIPATASDYVIANARVPAAAIRVGYLTNAQEAILLKREDHIEKIAAGIYNAIMAVYEEYF